MMTSELAPTDYPFPSARSQKRAVNWRWLQNRRLFLRARRPSLPLSRHPDQLRGRFVARVLRHQPPPPRVKHEAGAAVHGVGRLATFSGAAGGSAVIGPALGQDLPSPGRACGHLRHRAAVRVPSGLGSPVLGPPGWGS